jgi:hypothetical protein
MASFLPALMNAKALAFSLAFLATAAPSAWGQTQQAEQGTCSAQLKGCAALWIL